MTPNKHFDVSNKEMKQTHTEHIHSDINQFVTIKFSNAVLAMLCFAVSIGSILMAALSTERYLQIASFCLGIVTLFAGFFVLKKAQKLSSGREIHISNDSR